MSHGSKVHVQAFLAEGPNKHLYALRADEEDPAIRFSLKKRGTDTHGHTFCRSLHSHGLVMVKKMNTMVDRMNGVSMTDIAKTPGGLIPADRSVGRTREIKYT